VHKLSCDRQGPLVVGDAANDQPAKCHRIDDALQVGLNIEVQRRPGRTSAGVGVWPGLQRFEGEQQTAADQGDVVDRLDTGANRDHSLRPIPRKAGTEIGSSRYGRCETGCCGWTRERDWCAPTANELSPEASGPDLARERTGRRAKPVRLCPCSSDVNLKTYWPQWWLLADELALVPGLSPRR
jgi:hypothetical protein